METQIKKLRYVRVALISLSLSTIMAMLLPFVLAPILLSSNFPNFSLLWRLLPVMGLILILFFWAITLIFMWISTREIDSRHEAFVVAGSVLLSITIALLFLIHITTEWCSSEEYYLATWFFLSIPSYFAYFLFVFNLTGRAGKIFLFMGMAISVLISLSFNPIIYYMFLSVMFFLVAYAVAFRDITKKKVNATRNIKNGICPICSSPLVDMEPFKRKWCNRCCRYI